MGRLRPGLAAFFAVLLALSATAWYVAVSADAHVEAKRDQTARDLDRLASRIDSTVAAETASARTLAAFAESVGTDRAEIDAAFPIWAEGLLAGNPSIQSIQLAPDGVLEYVAPLEGNEAAVGLDLMADPERRSILAPTIVSGETSLQGPFDLVQGGVGLIVRHPIQDPTGEFWGFSAILLNWPRVVDEARLRPDAGTVMAVRDARTGALLFGRPNAFEEDSVYHTQSIGGTGSRWVFAQYPIGGWEAGFDQMGSWVAGTLIALLSGMIAYLVVRRPALIEEQRLIAVGELARSETRFQTMFDYAAVGIVIVGPDNRVVSANSAFWRIVAHAEWDLSLDPSLLVDPDDRDRVLREVQSVRRDVPVSSIEVRLAAANSVTKWVRVTMTSIPGEDTLIGILEDVTERVMATTAVSVSEERFRRLSEHAPIGIQREDHSATESFLRSCSERGIDDPAAWLVDHPDELDGLLSEVQVLHSNPAADELQRRLGSTPGPGPLAARFRHSPTHGYIETISRIAAGDRSAEYPAVVHTPDGEEVHLQIRWNAPDRDGRPDYSNILVTLQDITELVDTQLELQAQLDTRDRFIASVAHELRTPLTAVVGFAHELRNESGTYDETDRKEFVDLIAHHSGELSHLIEDLLVWARADIGEVDIRAVRVSIGDLVRQTIAALPDTVVPVEGDDEAHAWADPTRVAQIIRNLATNCMRYGGPDRRCVVSTDGDSVVVEVSDDGPPMSPEQMDRLFAPYERAAGPASLPGSIGLGLTVSRTLARLQEGDLGVSRRDGRTVFRLTLPRSVDRELSDRG